MITDSFDIDTDLVITLEYFYGPKKHILDKCIIILSKKIHDELLLTFDCSEIGTLTACNGTTTIYKLNYKGTDIAFYLSGIGSAVASMECYETHWVTGATQFIMFGSCGSLDGKQTKGKYIIPTESYRGEGTSYYYAEAADYITIRNSDKVAAFFSSLNIPHIQGKVWTTDSMIRETAGLVDKRKQEGCIAVEMELAGVQALCDFYQLELYNFLQSGDVLMDSGYEVEGLSLANHDMAKLHLGLEMALVIGADT